ncbi:MAG: alpha-L-fucosidase, partial [Bacteroidales bacterium]
MNVFHSFSIRSLLAVALFLFVGGQVSAQPYMPDRTSDDERMQWFADAKLGIFIHWGIYAV